MYRPVGWRYESARHSLAAKGISTRAYLYRIARGKELSSQLHLTGRLDDGGRIGEFEKGVSNIHGPHGSWVKPSPGTAVWSSTFRPGRRDVESDWARWVYVNEPRWITDRGVVFNPRPWARILQIRNEDDKKRFIERYGKSDETRPLLPPVIDWDEVAGDVDAVQLTSSGVGRDWQLDPFEGWDAESTVWLNKNAIGDVRDAGLSSTQKAKELKALAELERKEDKLRDVVLGKYANEKGEYGMEAFDAAYADPLSEESRRRSEEIGKRLRKVYMESEYRPFPKGWFAKKVDLKRYAGTWKQESVKNEPWFQKGLTKVTATYKPRKDGKITVINKGYKDGKLKVAKGVARSVSKDNRHLKVSFAPFGLFEGDYKIASLNNDYTRAVVKGGKTTWVLRR